MYVIPSKTPDALILIFTIIIMEGGFQLQDGVGPRQQLRRAQPHHQQMERTRPGRWLSFFFLILFAAKRLLNVDLHLAARFLPHPVELLNFI